jgi:threonine synthase
MIATPPSRDLGEGGTPSMVVEWRGLEIVYKLEHLNPSGSFKDRGAATSVSHAEVLGARCVVEDSSGNAGIAVARYARAAGLRATVYVPADAPEGKKAILRLLGAEVVEAPSRSEASKMVWSRAAKGECYYVDHLSSPFFIEGLRTVAYEVYEEHGTPDAVIVPFGSGGLFLGIYHGFRDLVELGMERRVPRMYAVQGASVAPLYEAVHGRKPLGTSRLADGIRVAEPPRLSEALEAIRSSQGDVVVVTDDEISAALRELLDLGLIVEPTSAAAQAALAKLAEKLKDEGVRRVLVPLTGSGLKMAERLIEVAGP